MFGISEVGRGSIETEILLPSFFSDNHSDEVPQ